MRHLDPDVRFIPGYALEFNRGEIAGLYMRLYGPVQAGYHHKGETHVTDHAADVVAGSILIRWRAPGGLAGAIVVEAPNMIPMAAECWHDITAVKDGTMWRCIFTRPEE